LLKITPREDFIDSHPALKHDDQTGFQGIREQ